MRGESILGRESSTSKGPVVGESSVSARAWEVAASLASRGTVYRHTAGLKEDLC